MTITVYLQYMLRRSGCYCLCHTPKKVGAGGAVHPRNPVSYACGSTDKFCSICSKFGGTKSSLPIRSKTNE